MRTVTRDHVTSCNTNDIECDLYLLFRTNRVVTASTHGDIDVICLLIRSEVIGVNFHSLRDKSKKYWSHHSFIFMGALGTLGQHEFAFEFLRRDPYSEHWGTLVISVLWRTFCHILLDIISIENFVCLAICPFGNSFIPRHGRMNCDLIM